MTTEGKTAAGPEVPRVAQGEARHQDRAEDGTAGSRKPRSRNKGFRLPRRFKKAKPGSPPGLEPHELSALPSVPGAARITCIDYSPAEARFEEVQDLADFMSRHRPEWSAVRWINVDGLSDLG